MLMKESKNHRFLSPSKCKRYLLSQVMFEGIITFCLEGWKTDQEWKRKMIIELYFMKINDDYKVFTDDYN